MRVLVTGSRTLSDRDAVWNALDAVVQEHPSERVTVVHGAAHYGADRYAAEWVHDQEYTGLVAEESYPADWHRAGRAAGVRRNMTMVKLGADLCLAFIMQCVDPKCRRVESHGTHGSVHCATAASRAGISVRHWRVERRPTSGPVHEQLGLDDDTQEASR